MRFLQKRVFGLRIRTWALAGLVVPLAFWGSANLFFSTSAGTRILSNELGQRLGVPLRFESATWTPWKGFTLRGIELLAPEEPEEEVLVSVRELVIDVSWTSLLKRKKRWERMVIDGLELEISLERMQEILARNRRESMSKRPAVSKERTDPPPPPVPDPRVTDQERKEALDPGKQPISKPKKEKVVRGKRDEFEGVVILNNAKIRLFSEKIPAFELTVQEVNAELPIWGPPRGGNLSITGVRFSEEGVESDIEIPLKWGKRSLGFFNHSLKVFGLDLEVSVAMRLSAGLPLAVQMNLPEQQFDLSSVFREKKSPLSVESVTSKNHLQGYLMSPSSFRGRSASLFGKVVVIDPRDGNRTTFERGGAEVTLSSSGLLVKDVRMIGEEDAVLMNGFASVTGSAAATVRIVSSPQRASSHAKRIRNSDERLLMDFGPFLTPDREFRDIRFETRKGVLMMDLGEDRSWVPFVPVVRAVVGKSNSRQSGL